MRHKEKFSDMYFLTVKPNTVWEEPLERGQVYYVVSLGDTKCSAYIFDKDETHHVVAPEKLEVYKVREEFDVLKVKNASENEVKWFLIMKKDK